MLSLCLCCFALLLQPRFLRYLELGESFKLFPGDLIAVPVKETVWIWRLFHQLPRLPVVDWRRDFGEIDLKILTFHVAGREDDVELSVLLDDGIRRLIAARYLILALALVIGRHGC